MKHYKARASTSCLFAKQFGNSQTIYLLNNFFCRRQNRTTYTKLQGLVGLLFSLKCIEKNNNKKMAKLTSSYPHTTNNFQPQNLFFSVKIIVKQHTQRAIQSSKPEKAGKRMGRENADVTREEVTTMAWQHQMYSGKQRKEDFGSGIIPTTY